MADPSVVADAITPEQQIAELTRVYNSQINDLVFELGLATFNHRDAMKSLARAQLQVQELEAEKLALQERLDQLTRRGNDGNAAGALRVLDPGTEAAHHPLRLRHAEPDEPSDA